MNAAQNNTLASMSAWQRQVTMSDVLTARWRRRLARCVGAAFLVCQLVEASAASSTAAKPPVKVFILAGQSNMEGYGGIKTIDELGDHPTLGGLLKKIKKADGSFVERDDVFLYYHRGDQIIHGPLTVGQGAHPDTQTALDRS